jgi:hypothetical protein
MGFVRRIACVGVLAAGLVLASASGSSAERVAVALNLHSVTWSAVTLPPVCGGSKPIELHRGTAVVMPIPRRWADDNFGGGHSVWVGSGPVVYGDLGGDAGRVAALNFDCTNGGGTADGELLNGYVVYSGEGDKLSVVGVVTPQTQHPPSDPVSAVQITITPGKITAHEFWSLYQERPPYKDLYYDSTGYWATTTWTYRDDKLRPGSPSVVKVCIATVKPLSGASRLRCHHP